MAAIAYGKGIIKAEQYQCRINAEKFSSFIHEHFASMFKKSANPRGKLFLQDDEPSQNSVKSRAAWDKIGSQKFIIPAHSPDLNPVENVFHIAKRILHHNALKLAIIREDFDLFLTGVKRTLEAVTVDVVDKTILSMNKRTEHIFKRAENQILNF